MKKYMFAFLITIPIILLAWNTGDSAEEQKNVFNGTVGEREGKQAVILQETDISGQTPIASPAQEQEADDESYYNETINALGMTLRDDTALLVKVRKYVSPAYHWVEEEYEYDREGRVLRHIKYYSNTKGRWEYEYDAAGNLDRETCYELEDGAVRYWVEYRVENGYSADESHRIGFRHEGDGSLVSNIVYNSEGNRVKETYYREDETVYWVIEYNDADCQTRIINYDEQENIVNWREFKYDAAGNMTLVAEYDADGNFAVSERYDYGRNTYIAIPHYWFTENEYDTAGNLIKSVNYDYEGNIEDVWEYTYDEAGHLMQQIHNGTITREYEYDSAGNMTKEITDPYTQWKKYEYDNENRIIKITENLPDEGRHEHRYEYRMIDVEE